MALLGAVAVFAASCWSGPRAWAADGALIVPGQSLGPARIGMTAKELTAALGPGRQGLPGMLVFPKWGIVAVLQGGMVVRLSTASPRFRTSVGAGVGTQSTQATRLIGDFNSVVTRSGADTTVLYPFQGVGFVFRGGRAVEAFVVERIAFGPVASPIAPAPAAPAGAPAEPGIPVSGSPPVSPGAAPGASGAGSPAAGALASLRLRDLSAAVDVTGPLVRVTGKLVNIGAPSPGAVTLTVVFHRVSGDDISKDAAVSAPTPAQRETPFTATTSLASDLVTRYTVRVSSASAGGPPLEETRAVPVSAYTELAKQRIKVDVQLGAPAMNTMGVQALVSIKDTSPIPAAWVKDARVSIPTASQAGQTSAVEVHVAPGQTVTVVIPSVPAGGVVNTPGGALGGVLIAPLVGQPQVLDVTLQGP